jgi:hypothetical protein
MAKAFTGLGAGMMSGMGAAATEEPDRAATAGEARAERMDRVVVLFAEITAAARELLRALAACDEHEDWAEEGFGSCAEWLAWRVGITRNAANEKVRAARALESLPLISAAMASGEISYSKVRALTRVATPECEAELLTLARTQSAATLERVVRGWKVLDRSLQRRLGRAPESGDGRDGEAGAGGSEEEGCRRRQ